jgi:hypothetical protein
VDIQRLISWISVAIILIIGILFLSGYIPLASPSVRLGFGIVIVLYAGVRSVLLYSARGARGKKP